MTLNGQRAADKTTADKTKEERDMEMNTYVIRREKAWQSPDELEATAERSKQVADDDFPDDIRWIRSYVIKEEGGTLGTVCIYQATNIEAVREHAKRVDMPADEVLEVADTVIIRPDPQPQAA
jgi:thiamine biosynthesis protein ThiC